MQLSSIETLEDKNYFEKLYQNAFPIEERIEMDTLYNLLEENLIEIDILRENDKNIGLAVIYLNHNIHLLSYFAIEKSFRGKGYGSSGLGLLKEKYDDLIIEIESTKFKDADDFAIRNKRKAFYIKNGYQVLDASVNYFGIEMELMSTTKDAGLEEYFDTYLNIFEEDFINENIKHIK